VRTGGCSDGFPKLDKSLAGIEQRLRVGNSQWRSMPAAQVVDAAVDAITVGPSITECDRAECGRCRDAILGGPLE
jgi:hypothetical protein